MGIITNKIYICLPFEKEVDKIDWNGLSTEEYNGKTYYKIPSGGNGSDVVKKITFETLRDNVTVTLNIVSSSEDRFDFAYACGLDGTSGYSNAKYEISGNNKSITCEYVVPNKGSHWIYIGYKKDGSGNYYNDCGYFSIDNLDKEYAIRQPKEVYLASDKMNEITYGSKKILEYGLGNTVSWKTMEYNNKTKQFTYDTNDKLYISYRVDSSVLKNAYLYNSPQKLGIPTDKYYYTLKFNELNSYTKDYTDTYTYNLTYSLDLTDLVIPKDKNTHIYFENFRFDWTYLSSIVELYLPLEYIKTKTNFKSFFYEKSNLRKTNVADWDVSNVSYFGGNRGNNNEYGTFCNCISLPSLDLSKWNISKAVDLNGMFDCCYSLSSIKFGSGWNTNNVTNMGYMFNYCKSLPSLDISYFDTTKVTYMEFMFNGCSSLTSLDLSNFNTTNVKSMGAMFSGCSSLTSLDLSNFNTTNVESMGTMFFNCTKLSSLNVSGFDTSNVTDMYRLFSGCSSLTSLDLSNWNASNVEDSDYMFKNCSELKTLIAGHESETNVTALNGLKVDIDLSDCTKLNSASIQAICSGLTNLPSDNKKTITVSKTKEGDLGVKIAMLNASIKNWNTVYK